eukprot:TRINITY_DN16859_c0_g1_i1.p1 TRINITY_DN16859_c0_g1~~TRINITY_DN16859_c0_g1_i1.p1  ORF type:complete len:382 (-),score=75.47 TRINITY_DN16859_c0_g1_i1:290-1435(-)
MTTIYIEEIDSDDEGPPTPPADGGASLNEIDQSGVTISAGNDDPEGVCSVLHAGMIEEEKPPTEPMGEAAYLMSWRHMQLSDKGRLRPRGGHATACLNESSAVVFGGADRAPEPFNDTTILDLHADSWTAVTAANPPQARSGHTLAVVGGRLYVFGGQDYVSGGLLNDMHTLDLSADAMAWTPVTPVDTGSVPCARSSHCCQAINDNLYLFGGFNPEVGLMNDLHVFHTSTNTWSSVEPGPHAPAPREMASAVVVGDSLYIFGGRGEGGPVGCTGIFSTSTMQWVEHNIETVEPRMAHAAAIVGNSMFVFGGASLQGITDQLLCLDTEKHEWNQVSCPQGSLPSARFAHTLTRVGECMALIGGIDPEKDMNDVHILELRSL